MAEPIDLEAVDLADVVGIVFLVHQDGRLLRISRSRNAYRDADVPRVKRLGRLLFLPLPGSTPEQRRLIEGVLVRYFQTEGNHKLQHHGPEEREWLYKTHPGLTRRVARALHDEGVHVTPTLVG